MIREEAIEYGTEWLKDEYLDAKDREFIKIAIEALKQEPCEDAISRQAVDDLVDELARAISDERCCISRGRSTGTIMIDILHLPSVKPQYTEAEIQKMQELEQAEIEKAYELGKVEQSKTGHWIYDKNIENWRCSECGETPKTIGYCGTADFMAEHFKYCNHCGAKMQEIEK